MKKVLRPLGRVDLQVSILCATMVLFSSLSVFILCYNITYNDTIKSLTDRVQAIYTYIENTIDKGTFEFINTREDMKTPLYQETKRLLEQIRNVTGVMYLYTAKQTENGELIYVIDGLSYLDDFRYPGDIIEQEIQETLQSVLRGDHIPPDTITNTSWGKIFITYLPIHDGNKIVGVVGIEFEATHQYNTYRILNMLTPIISVLFCFTAIIIAFIAFRRISNPTFLDMSNTDRATQLKNRNAFDVDMQNTLAKKNFHRTGIIVMDLNRLKKVNDTLGHTVGDRYIELAAEILKECCDKNMILYRTGGDEFMAFVQNADDESISLFLTAVHATMKDRSPLIGMTISISAGYAIYDPLFDDTLLSTYKRADQAMYQHKRQEHLQENCNTMLQEASRMYHS